MLPINKLESWPSLLAGLDAKKTLFAEPCLNLGVAKHTLGPVATIAKMISARLPDVLKQETVTICVVGAESHESLNRGSGFNLLPGLLSDLLSYQVDLVGDQIGGGLPADANTGALKIKQVSTRIDVTLYHCLLGSYLEDNTPDLIVMLHPGFEKFHESWLVDDSGVTDALARGIRIFGASYGDESAIDKLYLNAHGYDITAVQDNPFVIRHEPPKLPAYASKAIVDWAAQTWELKNTGNRGQAFFSDLLSAWREMVSFRAQTEDIPIAGLYTKTVMKGRTAYLNLFGEIYVSFKDGVIVDFSSDVICEDVEIDVSDIDGYKSFPFMHKTLKCALVYSNYLRNDMEAPEESLFGALDDVDSESLKQMLIDNGLYQEKRDTSALDKSINGYFEKFDGEELVSKLKESFAVGSLAGYLNEEKCNLLHLGCAEDNVALIELARELDIDPDLRNSDMYSPLDLCVADGGVIGLKALLKSYPSININASGAWGFTALHHTKSRSRPDMADVLKQHGAKGNIKNAAGLTYDTM